jgi:hypothetical protein
MAHGGRGASSVSCALLWGGFTKEAQMTIDPAILLRFRPRMMSVAYRMLGSVTDAEDAYRMPSCASRRRLSPDERAAFLLRTVFDYGYAEIAEVLGKSEVHVRQIVSRARHRLGHDAPRLHPAPHEADGLAERFVAACRGAT